MPEDLKDYLPDFDALLKETDRAGAEQKYRTAVTLEKAGDKPAEKAAETRVEKPAAEVPAAAKPVVAAKPLVVAKPAVREQASPAQAPRRVTAAEPPPTVVAVAKAPAVRKMPTWKLVLFALVFTALPTVLGVLVVRSLRAPVAVPVGSGEPGANASVGAAGAGAAGASAVPSAVVSATPSASVVPSAVVSATPSATPSGAPTTTGAAPTTTAGVKPALQATADPPGDASVPPNVKSAPSAVPSVAPSVVPSVAPSTSVTGSAATSSGSKPPSGKPVF